MEAPESSRQNDLKSSTNNIRMEILLHAFILIPITRRNSTSKQIQR